MKPAVVKAAPKLTIEIVPPHDLQTGEVKPATITPNQTTVLQIALKDAGFATRSECLKFVSDKCKHKVESSKLLTVAEFEMCMDSLMKVVLLAAGITSEEATANYLSAVCKRGIGSISDLTAAEYTACMKAAKDARK